MSEKEHVFELPYLEFNRRSRFWLEWILLLVLYNASNIYVCTRCCVCWLSCGSICVFVLFYAFQTDDAIICIALFVLPPLFLYFIVISYITKDWNKTTTVLKIAYEKKIINHITTSIDQLTKEDKESLEFMLVFISLEEYHLL